MATTTFVPVETYLRSSYEPDAEYVDGEIEERPAGEYDHAAGQAAILRCLAEHEAEWNITVLPSYRVQVAATRFRVPDVTVVDFASPVERIATRPPMAVLRCSRRKTPWSRFDASWPTTQRWEFRRYGSSIRKMARVFAIWMGSCCGARFLRSLRGGISFRMEEIGKLVRR